MALEDLSALADDPVLELPIDGRIYVVQGVDGETGVWATLLLELGQAALAGKEVDGSRLDDDQERETYARLMGDTYQELLDAGVKWERIKHCAYTTLLWVTSGMKAAETFWATWGKDAEGEAEARPNRATRRASEAAATTTRKRTPTSTTRATKAATSTARPGRASGKPGSS